MQQTKVKYINLSLFFSLSLFISLSPPKSKSEFPKYLLIGSLSLALHLIETCWLLQSSSLRQFVRIYKMSGGHSAAFHSNCFTFALHSNCSHLDSSDKFHHRTPFSRWCCAARLESWTSACWSVVLCFGEPVDLLWQNEAKAKPITLILQIRRPQQVMWNETWNFRFVGLQRAWDVIRDEESAREKAGRHHEDQYLLAL